MSIADASGRLETGGQVTAHVKLRHVGDIDREHDWSNQDERDANRGTIPAARATTIRDCGHFSCLENPARVAAIIQDFLAQQHERSGR